MSIKTPPVGPKEQYLAGAVIHQQRAFSTHTWKVLIAPVKESLTLLLFSSEGDTELWDFTLDGIEVLDVAAGGPSCRGLRPSTPGNHQMQTRSKTPQRPPGRPPEQTASQGNKQNSGDYRAQYQSHHQRRQGETEWIGILLDVLCITFNNPFPGEAFSPYRQGQFMKKRRLDT